jgi:hypothetical protein
MNSHEISSIQSGVDKLPAEKVTGEETPPSKALSEYFAQSVPPESRKQSGPAAPKCQIPEERTAVVIQTDQPVVIAPNPYTDGEPTPYAPAEPVHPVPWGRPGETVPNKFEDPLRFTTELLNATKKEAYNLETVGDCGKGVRLGLNDTNMGFHIEENMIINGTLYSWRSATQLGEYLYGTGLFDRIPLSKIQFHLQDGFIVVRHWNPQIQHLRGEDEGDIAVISHDGMQYNDHSDKFKSNNPRYDQSYVLIPKGYPMSFDQIDDTVVPAAPKTVPRRRTPIHNWRGRRY